MINLPDWLWTVPGHRLVPLFDVANDTLVLTRESGPQKRRLLCRSPEMEAAVIDMVEAGLAQESWQGLLYIMGWGGKSDFRPLYVGKAERKGVRNDLSANLAHIRTNRHMFARWGDGVAYHVGDLSQSLFGFKAYRPPTRKYKRWASKLFEAFDPPACGRRCRATSPRGRRARLGRPGWPRPWRSWRNRSSPWHPGHSRTTC
jgi:hypothetical protein